MTALRHPRSLIYSTSNELLNSVKFDTSRTMDGKRADSMVHVLLQTLGKQTAQLRRKPEKSAKHLKAILGNLLDNYHQDNTRYVHYSRSPNKYLNQPSRNPQSLSFHLIRSTIEALQDLGYIEQYNGVHYPESGTFYESRMRPTPKLINVAVNEHDLSKPLFCNVAGQGVILREPKKKDIPYDETNEIVRMRQVVQDYNQLITRSDIGLAKGLDRPIDLGRRVVRRIFNRSSFDLGGRFAGGWWQKLSGEERRHILIDGCPTVELDFQAMNVHLLYSLEGLSFDKLHGEATDPYMLPDRSSLERKLLKSAFLVSVGASSKSSAIRAIQREFRYEFPSRLLTADNLREILDEFAERNGPIVHHFYNDSALKLQNLDSQIAELVIRKMMKYSILSLCIHDSFIVKIENWFDLLLAMYSSFLDLDFISLPNIRNNLS